MPRDHMNQSNQKTSAAEQAFLSRDPNKAILEMMETITDLRAVYAEETKALQDADTVTFLNIQDRKLESARKYQKSIEEILLRKEEMRQVDVSQKKKLEAMQADFANLTKENMEALGRMQRTMERLGNTVRSAAKEAVNRQRAYSYGEQGVLKNNENKVVSTGVSETA